MILVNDFPRVTNTDIVGPWISITLSLHKLLGHSWEIIKNNENHGLGSLDKSGLEGSNKILRSIRSNLSRKISQTTNLADTISRMWVSSDPVLNNLRMKSQPYCTYCQEVGHNVRYCHKKNSQENILTEDETAISMLLHNEY